MKRVAIGPEIGKNVERFMKAAQLTQTELARLAGLSQPTVSELIRGAVVDPGFSVVSQLKKALGVSFEALESGVVTHASGSVGNDRFGFLALRVDEDGQAIAEIRYTLARMDARLRVLESRVL